LLIDAFLESVVHEAGSGCACAVDRIESKRSRMLNLYGLKAENAFDCRIY
jgi:hypothetical protein